MTWNEVVAMIKAYNKAVEAEDEETIAHICNVLPDELRFYENEVHIVIK